MNKSIRVPTNIQTAKSPLPSDKAGNSAISNRSSNTAKAQQIAEGIPLTPTQFEFLKKFNIAKRSQDAKKSFSNAFTQDSVSNTSDLNNSAIKRSTTLPLKISKK
jgi:hypothetical protein